MDQKSFIGISEDGRKFIDISNGKVFIPIGCNYFPNSIGWAPKVWSRFNEDDYIKDFKLIKNMNMNVVRIFLSLKEFIPDEMTINNESMDKCQKVLDIAQKNDIRVIFSGPSIWEGIPNWAKVLNQGYENYFTDDKILKNLEYFWEQFAYRFANKTSLFSIDLCNEPYITWDGVQRKKLWINFLRNKYKSVDNLKKCIQGYEDIEKWNDVNIPKVNDKEISDQIWEYQLFKNDISRNFVSICTKAIRKYDNNHLISIGTHPGTVAFDGDSPDRYFGFDPHYIGDLLDYISLHWYPYNGDMDITDSEENFEKNLALLCASLNYMDINKPIVLEEFGLYGGGVSPDFEWRKPFKYISQETQAKWLLDVIQKTQSVCSGWLNWAFRDYKEAKDPTRYQGLIDDEGNLKKAGKIYIKQAKELRNNKYQNESDERKIIDLNLKELVTDKKKSFEYRKKIIDEFMESSHKKFNIIK